MMTSSVSSLSRYGLTQADEAGGEDRDQHDEDLEPVGAEEGDDPADRARAPLRRDPVEVGGRGRQPAAARAAGPLARERTPPPRMLIGPNLARADPERRRAALRARPALDAAATVSRHRPSTRSAAPRKMAPCPPCRRRDRGLAARPRQPDRPPAGDRATRAPRRTRRHRGARRPADPGRAVGRGRSSASRPGPAATRRRSTPYQKWAGAHWRLAALAELDVPASRPGGRARDRGRVRAGRRHGSRPGPARGREARSTAARGCTGRRRAWPRGRRSATGWRGEPGVARAIERLVDVAVARRRLELRPPSRGLALVVQRVVRGDPRARRVRAGGGQARRRSGRDAAAAADARQRVPPRPRGRPQPPHRPPRPSRAGRAVAGRRTGTTTASSGCGC